MHKVTVEHWFEAGHRLPHLGGKCVSLHGHSWSAAVTVASERLSPDATVLEFGALKFGLRRWVDQNLDHATMLGARDELVEPLLAHGNRIFRFGCAQPKDEAEKLAGDLPWPTVEAVSILLSRVVENILTDLPQRAGVWVTRVVVRETRTNTAIFEPPRPR